MAALLGSYIGFKKLVITSGRFKYDQKLIVDSVSFISCRSNSLFPIKVPEISKSSLFFQDNVILSLTKVAEIGMFKN